MCYSLRYNVVLGLVAILPPAPKAPGGAYEGPSGAGPVARPRASALWAGRGPALGAGLAGKFTKKWR